MPCGKIGNDSNSQSQLNGYCVPGRVEYYNSPTRQALLLLFYRCDEKAEFQKENFFQEN